jgi:plastocyanin
MRLTLSMLAAAAAVVTAGCSDSNMATNPSRLTPSSVSAVKDADGDGHTKTVKLMDECDGPSFAANGLSCSRNGGLKFDQFMAQLSRLHEVPGWKFVPGDVHIRVGDVLAAMNAGGETHTFTEVAHFGGGIVPSLNAAAGLTTVAPECREAKFLPPGASTSEVADEEGDEMYQCCIHPWMRAVVHVSEK